ncbi:MAG: C45 family autoproteolytic acyltransferase/hydrolase [Elainella sp.]
MHLSSLMSRLQSIRWSWKRSALWYGLLVVLGILLTVSRAHAADTVLLQYYDKRLSLPLGEVKTFAEGGTLTPELQTFLAEAEQDPDSVREALTRELPFVRLPLVPTEFALLEVNKALGEPLRREDQLDRLSQAFQKSTRKDKKFTVLELLENYPSGTVRLSLGQLLPVYENVSLLVTRLAPVLYVAEQFIPELVCDAQGKPIYALLDQPSDSTALSQPAFTPVTSSQAAVKTLAQNSSSPPTAPINAADLPDRDLVIALGPLRLPISLQELTHFANTGELPRAWKFYLNVAQVDRDGLRTLLNQTIQVDGLFLDKTLSNVVGEYLLYQMGQVLHSPSRIANIQSLRSALLLSTLDDGTVSLLEVLKNYPHPQLFVDAGKLIQIGNRVKQFQTSGGVGGAVVSLENFLVNVQRTVGAEECTGQPVPPVTQPQVEPLQISAEQRAQYLPANWQPVPAHKEKIGNINVVWLTGTPYEMGFQHGQLLKQEIASLSQPVITLLDIVGRGIGLARLAEKRSFPYVMEECRGMAEGAKEIGLTYDACMVLAYGDVYQYAFGNALPQELLWEGCSQFVATGAATLNGNLYHGSTVDSSTPMRYLIDNPVVFVRQPQNGLPHVFVTYPGVVWPNSGMNVASITVGLDTAVTDETGLSPYGGSNVQFMAEILQGATQFEEAANFMATQPRVRPNLIMTADGKSQQAGVFEFSGTAFHVRPMAADDILYATNHFASEEMFDKQIEPEESSLLRFVRYQQLLDPAGRDSFYGQINEVAMSRILRDRVNPQTLEDSPLDLFDDNASPGGNGAQRQAIFESKPLLLWVAAGPPPVPENPFVCFSMGELLNFPNATPCPAPAIE